jgi:hypothetical protein
MYIKSPLGLFKIHSCNGHSRASCFKSSFSSSILPFLLFCIYPTHVTVPLRNREILDFLQSPILLLLQQRPQSAMPRSRPNTCSLQFLGINCIIESSQIRNPNVECHYCHESETGPVAAEAGLDGVELGGERSCAIVLEAENHCALAFLHSIQLSWNCPAGLSLIIPFRA